MKRILVPAIVFFLVAAACNLQRTTSPSTNQPGGSTPNGSNPTLTLASSATTTSTSTLIPTITNTLIPCNQATFNASTIDVTIPDYTYMTPGQHFTKTWRIRNSGTCSWTSSYLLIFFDDNPMGVGAGFTQMLTPGTVNPGQEVDLTVNLTAPMANGTYSGAWKLKAPNGEVFGLNASNGAFYVRIKVATPHTVSLTVRPAESGAIYSNGVTTATMGVGESGIYPGAIANCFLSYDITGIPNNAIITEVKTDFTAYTTNGTPFSLGVLNVYGDDFGLTLEASDYVSGFPGGNIADFGSLASLNVIESQPLVKSLLQSKLGGGGRLQLRLQFPGPNGGTPDYIIFTNPTLVVSYLAP